MDRNGIGDGQIKMEANIKAQIDMYLTQQASSINGMMQPEFVACSYEEKTLTIAFPVLEWEKNRIGRTPRRSHSRLRSTSRLDCWPDISPEKVSLRRFSWRRCSSGRSCLGDVFEVVVKTNLAGRKLTHMYCEGFVKSTGKLAATATASYLNENTNARPASE